MRWAAEENTCGYIAENNTLSYPRCVNSLLERDRGGKLWQKSGKTVGKGNKLSHLTVLCKYIVMWTF